MRPMRHPAYRFVSALAAIAVLSAPLSAHAQQPQQVQVIQTAPAAPPGAQAPNGQYVAPLSQTSQPTYVPQSVAMSGPRIIRDYQEGEPIPPGYHEETRVRTGLIVGGAVTFGVLYLISLLVAAGGSDISKAEHSSNPVAALYVPCFGPFIQMASTSSSTANIFLAIDGIAQTGGAAMLIGGIVAPKTVLVRNDLGQIHVAPLRVGRDGMGLGLSGTF